VRLHNRRLMETNAAPRRRVLITGAAGRIGRDFSHAFRDRYELRLMVQHPKEATKIADCGDVVVGDLTDIDALKQFCEGVDTVIHLAGRPEPSAVWSDLLPANIVGTYNLMVAAKSAGCRRVVYASSIHAVSGYAKDIQVKTDEPVNPGDLYGVTKCFAEALGRYMATQEGLSVIAVRIGSYETNDPHGSHGDITNMNAYVSRRDLASLFALAVDDEKVGFAIVHGLSDNFYKRLDISSTRDLLGYDPVDDFAAQHPKLAHLDLTKHVRSHSNVADGGKSGLRQEL